MRGADLYTRASDVPVGQSGEVGAVVPGRTTELAFEVGNGGSMVVRELVVKIRLPRQVSFAQSRNECVYGSNGSTATCTYQKLMLIPVQDDENPKDNLHSALRFTHRLRVSASAPAPAFLAGGEVTAEPIAIESKRVVAMADAGALPDGVIGRSGIDLDSTDNVDRFVVFTKLAAGTGGGLPVTGAPAGLLGGIGLASLLLGGVLVGVARRRRGVAEGDGHVMD